MRNGITKLLIGTSLALGLTVIPAFAQEGDIVQREKAQREKELRERNAQPKAGQPAVGSQGSSDKASGSSDNTAKKKKTGKRTPTDKTDSSPPKP